APGPRAPSCATRPPRAPAERARRSPPALVRLPARDQPPGGAGGWRVPAGRNPRPPVRSAAPWPRDDREDQRRRIAKKILAYATTNPVECLQSQVYPTLRHQQPGRTEEDEPMSITHAKEAYTVLPDDEALKATVVAL